MILEIIVSLILIPFASWVFYKWIEHRIVIRKYQHIPGPSYFSYILHSLVGSKKDALFLFPRRQRENVKRYGKTYKIIFGSVPNLVTSDPEVVKQVFVSKGKKFIKDPIFFETNFLGPDIFNSEGEEWRRHRTLAQPAFTDSSMAHVHDSSIVPVIRTLVQKWENMLNNGTTTATVNINLETGSVAFDAIGLAGFGCHLNSVQGDNTYVRIVQRIFEYNVMRFVFPKFIWNNTLLKLTLFRPFEQCLRKWESLLSSILNNRAATATSSKKEDNKKNDIGGAGGDAQKKKQHSGDLMDYMINAVDESNGGSRYTNKELRADLSIFMVAGHETTAATIAWAIYYLSTIPEVLSKVREEVDSVLGGQDPTHETVGKLKYCLAVMKEVLRMHPPAFTMTRVAAEDVELGGYMLPKGTRVIMNLIDIQNSEEFWEEPDKFRPERFIANPKSHLGFTYLPFGAGNRMCIGFKFAELEFCSVLAMLVQKFDIALAPNCPPVKESIVFALKPSEIIAQIKKRSDNNNKQ